ncbi:MAG: hypothetical protein GX162_07590 [Firmicutes bacterium]|nr:hypothetical protein [Bacillota bacterium]
MILDEQLRLRIDAVLYRLRRVDQLTVAVRAMVASLLAFAPLRGIIGLAAGGEGGLISFALALIVGVTYIIVSRRPHHTRLSAARFIDRQLSLEDRLATAVERSGPESGPGNRVEQWLFADVAGLTRFIRPEELVPYRRPREVRWLVPLLIVAVVLSMPIYPKGFTWQIGGGEWQEIAKKADELDALADQLEYLAQQQPELREVAELMRNITEQLRDRRLSRSEALRLLQEFEREMHLSADAQGVDLDLSYIQNLAQRLQRINPTDMKSRESASQWLSQNQRRGGVSDRDPQYGTATDEYQEYTQTRGTPIRNGDGDSEISQQSASGGQSSGDRSLSESTDLTGGYDTDYYDPFMDDESYMSGSSAGVSRGDDRQDESFQRSPEIIREFVPVSGSISESGPMITGQAEGTMVPGEPIRPRVGGSTLAIMPVGIEQAVTQEQIPLAYRHWVKRYFESIEPGQEP